MDSVIKYVNGFFGGLLSVMMAVLPLTILWTVLTGTSVFGMDVIAYILERRFGVFLFVNFFLITLLKKA